MSSVEVTIARVSNVFVTDDTLSVDLEDGRTVSVPLGWYPRLVHGTETERSNFEISGAGYGVHWPDLDEDIGVEGLLLGRHSLESSASFERWIERRKEKFQKDANPEQPPDQENVSEIIPVGHDNDFRAYLSTNPTGLVIVPERRGEDDELILKGDARMFAKWIKINKPSVFVDIQKADKELQLRSSDHWLPLVFLATDVALPVFLHIVAAYLFDRLKGALRGESARVHLSVIYEDKATGLTKQFNFEGDAETLQKIIKKFDANEFTND
ncbi:MAG: DUF2442 domain-containing protein [Acidobacteriota bacterium]